MPDDKVGRLLLFFLFGFGFFFIFVLFFIFLGLFFTLFFRSLLSFSLFFFLFLFHLVDAEKDSGQIFCPHRGSVRAYCHPLWKIFILLGIISSFVGRSLDEVCETYDAVELIFIVFIFLALQDSQSIPFFGPVQPLVNGFVALKREDNPCPHVAELDPVPAHLFCVNHHGQPAAFLVERILRHIPDVKLFGGCEFMEDQI